MEVIEKPENDPEWWRCRNARGLVGLVPKNYVVVFSDGPAPLASCPSPYTGPAHTSKFAGKDWYYGNVTRHQAECALNERGVEGDFLVRDSESSVSIRVMIMFRLTVWMLLEIDIQYTPTKTCQAQNLSSSSLLCK